MEKITVRILIEMLAKCDWDNEVLCVSTKVMDRLEKAKTKNYAAELYRDSQKIKGLAFADKHLQIMYE